MSDWLDWIVQPGPCDSGIEVLCPDCWESPEAEHHPDNSWPTLRQVITAAATHRCQVTIQGEATRRLDNHT